MIVYFSPLVNDLTGIITPGGRWHGETGRGQATPPKSGPHRALFAPKHTRKRKPPAAGVNDPRRNYEKASYIWSSWTDEQRRPWREAIKRGGLCARDVWMRGALYNFARDLYAPDAPGPSDGCARACKRPKPPPLAPPVPGEVWQPPKKLAGHWDQSTDCNFGAAWEKEAPPGPPWPPTTDCHCYYCAEGTTPGTVYFDMTTLPCSYPWENHNLVQLPCEEEPEWNCEWRLWPPGLILSFDHHDVSFVLFYADGVDEYQFTAEVPEFCDCLTKYRLYCSRCDRPRDDPDCPWYPDELPDEQTTTYCVMHGNKPGDSVP